jgi:hypothetical protein
MDDRDAAEQIRAAFANLVAGTALHQLDSAPKHTPDFYIQIWRALELHSVGRAAAPLPSQVFFQPLPHLSHNPSSQVQATED